jgi:hypothetical protein
MTTPRVDMRVKDGGLGLTSTPAKTLAFIGACSGGSVGDHVLTTDPEVVKSTFGSGALVEAVCHALTVGREAGVQALAVKVNPSVAGTTSAVSWVRASSYTGTLTVSGAPNDAYDIIVEVVSTEAVVASGTGAWRYSLDGGDTWSEPLAFAVSVPITGTGLTFAFTGLSTAFERGDVARFSAYAPGYGTTDLTAAIATLFALPYTWQTLVVVGTPASSSASAAVATLLQTQMTARAAAKYWAWAIMQAGFGKSLSTVSSFGASPPVVTVSGTPADAEYSFRLEITTGGALGTSRFRWRARPSDPWTSNVATAASVVLGATGITAAFAAGTASTDNVYTFTCAETDATMASAFAAFAPADPRVGVCAGNVELLSSVTGRQIKAPLLYSVAARVAKAPLHEDLGRVLSGSLESVTSIYRDELLTPGLDTARFITTRTWENRTGRYITQGNLMAPDGSDYTLHQYRQIVDVACAITYSELVAYANEDLLLADDGTIDPREATRIEQAIAGKLTKALQGTPRAVTRLAVQVRRDVNLASGGALSARVQVQPKGYAKLISADVGLVSTVEEVA